jgi:hypothetical protein
MICAYEECQKDFTPKTHNQKYCCDECCRTATNKKLKEQYYAKKARLAGAERICKRKGCDTKLVMYNESDICSGCIAEDKAKERDVLVEMMRSVSGKTRKA